MLYPSNTKKVETVRMKYIWNSNEFRMIWTLCELYKNYVTSTQELHMNLVSLASLLCTSYEWAFRSIVLIRLADLWTH